MMTAYILVSLLLAVQPTAPPKQAVVETAAGTFIIDLDPEAAPNQVAYFMKLAQQGAFDGTTFHRVVKYGMVQGGDPLSKDPSKRALYGTDRKSTRLNSSHTVISYAVFCLKKKIKHSINVHIYEQS